MSCCCCKTTSCKKQDSGQPGDGVVHNQQLGNTPDITRKFSLQLSERSFKTAVSFQDSAFFDALDSFKGLLTDAGDVNLTFKTSTLPELNENETEELYFGQKDDEAFLMWLNSLYGTSARNYSELPDVYKMLDCPDLELKMVQQLRQEFPISKLFHTDADLWRFARARDFDWKDVHAMYNKFVQELTKFKRLGVGITPMVREIRGVEWESLNTAKFAATFMPRPPEETAWIRMNYRCFQDNVAFGEDREGNPVVYSNINTPVKLHLAAKIPLEARLLFHIALYKQIAAMCHLATQRHGRLIYKCTVVLDVKGVDLLKFKKHIGNKETKLENEYLSDYFPERAGKIIVVNAPFGVGPIVSIVKTFLPKRTQEKLHVFGSDSGKDIQKYIHPDRLPKLYGGNCDFEYPEKEDFDTFTDY